MPTKLKKSVSSTYSRGSSSRCVDSQRWNTEYSVMAQLREEKINLENTREAESESQVNRMARELTALRMSQQQQYGTSNSSVSVSPETGMGFRSFMTSGNPNDPSAETMIEAMRRENEQLRNKLVETERDYIRIKRLNEVYREELIEHRSRVCFLFR